MTGEPTLKDASRLELLLRRARIAAHQTRRVAAWWTRAEQYPRLQRTGRPLSHLVYSARIPLPSPLPDAHPVFEAGKKHNVALAAPAFDGLLLPPGAPFSFWRALGRVTASGGYRHGMELAGGCIVPAIGGGLCLLSRALFQAAVYSGFRIVERHGHSMQAVLPPPGVPWGLDATVLWPYVDLRFSSVAGHARLGVRVRDEALLVTVTADAPLRGRYRIEEVDERETRESDGLIRHNRILRHLELPDGARAETEVVAVNRTRVVGDERRRRNCLTCGEDACHAQVKVPA